MTSNWGGEYFQAPYSKPTAGGTNRLETAVAALPPKVKQAFYGAAIRKGVIKRGTWNGCAFNEGGIEIGDTTIASHYKAAELFGISEELVGNFISAWDHSSYSSDSEATEGLLGILERIGIFTEPGDIKAEAETADEAPKPVLTKRIVNETVWESTLSDAELTHAFRVAVENDSLHDWDSGLAELIDAAELVLA